MKKTLPWLMAAAMVLLSACSDDDGTGTREEVRLTRTYTTEVVAGNVSGTWTTGNSPYYVAGDITIPAGDSLIIQAGVDVWMHDRTSIFVEGTLRAEGSLNSPIRFYGYVAEEDYGLWQSLVFRPGSDASHLSYCIVAFGAKFDNSNPERNAGIVCRGSSPTIEHCLVWMNQYNGIALQGRALPKLRSNIVFENDGSGIVFDSSHYGNHERIANWLSDSLMVHNNVSSNSSLQFRYSTDFAYQQWLFAGDSAGVDLHALGNDVIGEDQNGNDVYRLNENDDRCDIYGNSIQDPMFDELSEDFQSFNSCSPCIQAAFDFEGADRNDMGPIFYAQAANELRKRIKNPSLGGVVYTVTCDAYSHEPVTITGSTIQFAGYYGLRFDSGLRARDVSFEPTADRMNIAAWKSVVVSGNSAGNAVFENCEFKNGTESSNSGGDWIASGGMVELRQGAVAELTDCAFTNGASYAVSAHGLGTMAWVDSCTFVNNGLSAVYFNGGARGRVSNSDIRGCGSYGIFLYNTGYGTLIENNLIAQGELYGIKLQASPEVDILQNTIVENAYGGIKLENNSDPYIRYNLIVNNDFAGSSIATGIVGSQIGLNQDTNNPNINVNVFSGNGGSDSLAMPGNWSIGSCNSFAAVTLPPGWAYNGQLADCENGGVNHPIGRGTAPADYPDPVLGSLGVLQILEDGEIARDLGAISYSGDSDFSYAVTCNDPSILVILNGTHLILRPAANYFTYNPENPAQQFPPALVTVTVSNGQGSDSEVSPFTVTAVNDAPVFAPIADQTLAVGGSLVQTLSATDVEGDTPLFYSAVLVVLSGTSSGHVVSVTGTTLTVTPDSEFTGVLQVNLSVVDGDVARERRAEGTTSFLITVQ